jgi:hypothetical protein
MSAIRQFGVEYLPVEDRLLLRMSAEGQPASLKFLLTRRFLRLFWLSLTAAMRKAMADTANPAARDFLLDMAETRATAKADFATPFREPAAAPPAATGAAVAGATAAAPAKPAPPAPPSDPAPTARLLWGVDVKRGDDANCAIVLVCTDNTRIDLGLPDAGVFGLLKILRDAARKAEWDVDMDWTGGTAPPKPDPAAARRLN